MSYTAAHLTLHSWRYLLRNLLYTPIDAQYFTDKTKGGQNPLPVQPLLHVHAPVEPSHDPLPLQPSPGQGLSLLTVVWHAVPVNPLWQEQTPVWELHVPLPLQLDGHVLALQSAPVNPDWQEQTPVWVLQFPLPEQSLGQLFCFRMQFIAFAPVPFS